MHEADQLVGEGSSIMIVPLRFSAPTFRQSRAGTSVDDVVIAQVIYEYLNPKGNRLALRAKV
jgi:hypothetical protein